MAYLTSCNTNHPIYLKTFHQFGRLESAVDTLIYSPEISRIHGIIEWIDNAWFIRDLSKNGIWLNHKRIIANRLYQLALKDNIYFANKKNISFIVENIEKPRDLLIPYNDDIQDNEQANAPIYLDHYHMLPSEKEPEIVVFYDVIERSWFCEDVVKTTKSKISDGELLKFSQSMWQLIKGADISEQETISLDEKTDNTITFIFNISRDEESTELIVKNNNDDINCDFRSHHYLTALLARYRSQDFRNLLPEHLQGWRSIEQLTKDIGLSESHVNIQIHRARKQIADKLKKLGLYAPLVIERKKGQVRFASTDYKIFKGQSLEEDSKQLTA